MDFKRKRSKHIWRDGRLIAHDGSKELVPSECLIFFSISMTPTPISNRKYRGLHAFSRWCWSKLRVQSRYLVIFLVFLYFRFTTSKLQKFSPINVFSSEVLLLKTTLLRTQVEGDLALITRTWKYLYYSRFLTTTFSDAWRPLIRLYPIIECQLVLSNFPKWMPNCFIKFS